MRRGEVWWISFPGPAGRRPAVLVSRDQAYRVRAGVTVVPLTRKVRHIRVEVPLGPTEDIPHASVANADDITTVQKARVDQYLTTLSPEKLEEVERAIKFALDLR